MSLEIKKESLVKCPYCLDVSLAEEWDRNSYANCISREMKRAYKSITDIKVWGKNSNNFYKCLRCGMWSRGNQLILIDEDGSRINGVGGYPIMKIAKKKNTNE